MNILRELFPLAIVSVNKLSLCCLLKQMHVEMTTRRMEREIVLPSHVFPGSGITFEGSSSMFFLFLLHYSSPVTPYKNERVRILPLVYFT